MYDILEPFFILTLGLSVTTDNSATRKKMTINIMKLKIMYMFSKSENG